MQNRLDHIPVSDKLNNTVNRSLEMINKKYRKSRIKKLIVGFSATAAVFTAAIIFCISNPVLAASIPFVGRIFTDVEKDITFAGDYSSKAKQLISEASTTSQPSNLVYRVNDNGLTITASEVYCDGFSIYLALNVNSEKSLGKMCSFYTSSYGEANSQFFYTEGTYQIGNHDKEIQLINNHIEGKQTSDTSFKGIMKLDLKNLSVKEEPFNLKLKLKGLGADTEDSMKSNDISISGLMTNGTWAFTIPITVDTLNVKTYNINNKNDEGYGINNIAVTPYQIIIDTFAPQKEFGVAIFDQNGDRIEFENGVNNKILYYAVKGERLKKLYIYIGTNAIDTLKETNQQQMEAKAIYKTEVDLSSSK